MSDRKIPQNPDTVETALDFEHDGDSAHRPHGNCYWLARNRMIAGEYPRTSHDTDSRQKLESILDARVRRFIDLTEADEGLEPYSGLLAELASARGLDVVHRRHPIVDLSVPSHRQMRGILDELREPVPGVTYVHCWGGIGRTGTVVGCLLIESGYSADQAISLIARKWRAMDKRHRRPQSPETQQQFEFIRGWERSPERRP